MGATSACDAEEEEGSPLGRDVMAKKSRNVEPPAPPVLVILRADARRQIEERIEKGRAIRARVIQGPAELEQARNEYSRWNSYNTELLTRIFSNAVEAEAYAFWGVAFVGNGSYGELLRDLHNDLDTKINRLQTLVEKLELVPDPSSGQPKVEGQAAPVATLPAAFVVHGHDEAARETVARFLERLGVRPVILHEQANKGLTVIEKFEAHANVPLAIVLMTPDDVGAPKASANSPQPRARQNVIFELGFFYGRLGRARVCALHKEGVELPSDIVGVVYVKMDDAGAWKLLLAKEMREAGLPVDLNQAI